MIKFVMLGSTAIQKSSNVFEPWRLAKTVMRQIHVILEQGALTILFLVERCAKIFTLLLMGNKQLWQV